MFLSLVQPSCIESTHCAGAGRKLGLEGSGACATKRPRQRHEWELNGTPDLWDGRDPHRATSRERLKSTLPSKLPVPLLSFPIFINICQFGKILEWHSHQYSCISYWCCWQIICISIFPLDPNSVSIYLCIYILLSNKKYRVINTLR